MTSSKHEKLRDLARRIQQIESIQRPAGRLRITTGMAVLDDLLPEGGLKRGGLVDLVSAADGGGAWTLGVVMATKVCRGRKMLVIVDAERRLYPPAAAKLGLELNRSIVVHPGSRRDAHQALVQSLRCTAVGAVLSWQERLSMREFRRLQLAAETGGAVAILLRPREALRLPSCAAVRLLVSPESSHHAPRDAAAWPVSRGAGRVGRVFETHRLLENNAGGPRRLDPPYEFHQPVLLGKASPDRPSVRRMRVEVLRCPGRVCGQSLVWEIDDETGHVRVPAYVAPATVVARAARASG